MPFWNTKLSYLHTSFLKYQTLVLTSFWYAKLCHLHRVGVPNFGIHALLKYQILTQFSEVF